MNRPNYVILAVDDSLMMRKIIRKELEAGQYTVIEAEGGKKALQTINSGICIDLITLDIEMPEMDGFTVLNAIRDIHPERLPIVFITGNDSIQDRLKGYSSGCADFITKPFKQGELLSAVNDILSPIHFFQGLKGIMTSSDSLIRMIVPEIVVRTGFDLQVIPEHLEATAIRSLKSGCDLALIDLVPNETDLRKQCTELRDLSGKPDLPIIVISEFNDGNSIFHWFKSGATDYIIKPFIREEFLARIIPHLTVAIQQKQLRMETKSKIQTLPVSLSPGPDLQVLLVDDSRINAMVAQKMLTKFQCLVTLACNGKEAVSAVGTRKFQIIFMDIHMPVMNGIEATRIIRKYIGPKTPIIGMSAEEDSEILDEAIHAGMSTFIHKPFNMEELESLLEIWQPVNSQDP